MTEKLVRDNIPELSRRQARIASPEEFVVRLGTKLLEEGKEYCAAITPAQKLEELADVLEVVLALTEANGFTLDELQQARHDKCFAKGGFVQRYVMNF